MTMASNPFSHVPPLFANLEKIIHGDIDCSFSVLSKYSRSNSPYYIQPQAVIYPKNSTDIKHVLAFARDIKMPVTVRGFGLGEHGGCLGEGIIIDTTRYFSQIRKINMLEQTVTVDAGVSVNELLKRLHSWQFDIPCLDITDDNESVGACVATRSTTSSSFHHGTVRDWVEGLTVVVDNGEEHYIADGITPSGRLLGIYQSIFPLLSENASYIRANKPTTPEEVSGYSIWNTSIGPRQLIDELTGSEGTLGIITSVTFRVTPIKKHSQVICVPVIQKEDIPTITKIAKEHKAEKIFFCDHIFMELSKRYSFEELPHHPDASYLLFILFSHNDKEKNNTSVAHFKKAIHCDETYTNNIPEEMFTKIISPSFVQQLASKYGNNVLSPLHATNGLSVKQNDIPNLLQHIEDVTNKTGKVYAISGFIGSGHIAVTALFDLYSSSYEKETFDYSVSIFKLLTKYKGSISAIGGDGITKAPYISYKYNDTVISIFKEIKKAWDPLGILNPGKKIGTSFSYLQKHIIKDR